MLTPHDDGPFRRFLQHVRQKKTQFRTRALREPQLRLGGSLRFRAGRPKPRRRGVANPAATPAAAAVERFEQKSDGSITKQGWNPLS